MFGLIVFQETIPFPVKDCTRRYHFGVKQNGGGNQPQKITIMPVSAVHHRGNGNSPVKNVGFFGNFRFSRHKKAFGAGYKNYVVESGTVEKSRESPISSDIGVKETNGKCRLFLKSKKHTSQAESSEQDCLGRSNSPESNPFQKPY